jgi:hypothetical protein
LPSSELAALRPSSTSTISADLAEFGLAEAAGGACRRAEANARGDVGFSGSLGTPFLLQVMLARPSAFSDALPVRFFGLRSTSIRWVSVPPETMSSPPLTRVSASTLALATTLEM